jgi:hypothetical protein
MAYGLQSFITGRVCITLDESVDRCRQQPCQHSCHSSLGIKTAASLPLNVIIRAPYAGMQKLMLVSFCILNRPCMHINKPVNCLIKVRRII